MNLNCFSFILAICLSSIYVQPALANWPVVSIKTGGTAVVPCLPKGETAYFWSKGEDFANSQSVASRVLGIPSSDSEKYLVNEEGSLVIYNVTLSDGGIYHCRIVSENTNCRGAVSINVTVNDFSFGIEQCKPNKSCSLQVEPSKETNLTCTAKGGPSSLSLKWFNGSKEITSVYSEHSLNEESITVSETITVPNEFGLFLTCAAIASEDGPSAYASTRVVHVMLQEKYKDISSVEWISIILPMIILIIIMPIIYDISSVEWITILLMIILIIIMPIIYDISSVEWITILLMIILIIIMLIIYALNIKLETDTHKLMQTIREVEKPMLLRDELTRFKQKGGKRTGIQVALQETTAELEQAMHDLAEKEMTLTDTTAELDQIKNDLTEKEMALTDTSAELERVKNDLTDKETKLTDTTAELEKVKNNLTEKETTLTDTTAALEKILTDTTAELEKVKNDLTKKETTLTDTTAELEKVKNDLTEKETKLTDTTAELEKVKNDLTEKETKLTDKTAELEKVKNDLTEKETKLTESSFQTRKPKRRSGKTSSLESGLGSIPENAEIKDAIYLHNKSEEKTYRRARRFQSSETITKDGGRLEIKGTDVSLLVPPGAVLEDCKIHIQIISGNLDTGDDVTFASNSAVIVELTPNNFEFQTAVELHLPHCLQLKENFTSESMEVFASHHHPKASPHWERDTEVKFDLQEETCKLYLKKFCWITLRINNEIVEAKRLKIFTVGSKVIDTDSETTVHVGYFPDVPGNEDIFIDENITVGQYKPFWFKKEEPTPLVIFLEYLTPSEWKNTADKSRKVISYQDIASSKNRSCEFVLRCISSVRRSGVPYATFRVYRQHDSTNISFRPKIWNDVSEDEEP